MGGGGRGQRKGECGVVEMVEGQGELRVFNRCVARSLKI